ncbi:TonB-dependent receptor [Mucilaginibacter sp. 14171R-50]|uniref:SusC/RagA family TonB-linked outer membrane protein n=1 Tax=Mucilaginibacter sp. 14171R-50 TaxID=2703789 RepID=UPI00138B1C3F|nr:TonB-dependent receptor [Mucilaginibacter sp. 14171R-50]QHS54703.1 TonB-dependent receptor [Mucilaginibacter sp. 14171R-50]
MKRIYSISGLLLLFTFLSTAVFAQNVTIKGKVTDAKTGEALIGVTVGVKGTTTGTQTDVNGAFQLNAASNATLQISYIGYTPQDIAITGQTTLDIKLQPTTNELQGVVVVGYGTQRKIDVTGSVAQIKGSEISKQSSINPISSLQGKVAGVQITNSGAPGASPTVRIRGAGTIYGNANPLYVVDGVWNEDISFLNPNDIESISVLKDASSEAIYGIRAANGVILITTKKGTKNSGAKISYDGFIGTQVVTNDFKMATGPEYATLVNELDERSGVTPRYADPNSFGTTDWAHQVLRSGLINNHNLSINGGGEKSTYSVSFGYLKQQGTVETNSFDRYTMRIKNDFDLSKALKIGYTVAGSMNNSRDIDGSIFHQIFAAVPITPVRYADGTYGDPNDFNVTSSAMFNPQVTLDFFNQRSKNYRLNGSAYADLKFANHFTFHTSVGGDFGQGQVVNYAPVYQATLAQQNSNSLLTLTDNKTRNWIIENTLTYDNTFGDHNLKVLVGQGAQSYRYNQTIASATDVPDNGNGYYLSQGKNYNLKDIDAGGGYPFYNTVSSYFARVNYSFKNKYLLNATMRADGSSKFSDPNKWGYFPSVGAGWVISEENFMKDQHVFNSLKLRGSWGKIGNMSVPANLSITTVTQTPQFIYVGPDGYTAPGANVNTITPPVTYWERGVGTDVGVEASLLNDRLFAEVDFYNKKTEKAIFDIPILGSLGTSGSSIIGNQATFQNQGFEFLLSWKDKIGSDFSYSIGGNLGINDNKVLEVSSGRNPIYQAVSTPGSNNFNTRTVVGEPIGQFYGLKVVGIFQTDAEVAAYKNKAGGKIQPEAIAGNFKYQDTNGDGIIDDKDRVVLGNPNPKFTYGFNTYFAYKSFDLTADFQGVAGVQIYNANVGLRFGTENFSQDFYNNRWHGEGTSNTYPSAFIAGGQNNRSNSFYVEDGSYFRIRNLQLGYTLPSAITNSLKIAKVRLYANAQNAFNFFSYKGFSPEVGGGPTRAGVDVNVYPLYATYNFGVNVTF